MLSIFDSVDRACGDRNPITHYTQNLSTHQNIIQSWWLHPIYEIIEQKKKKYREG